MPKPNIKGFIETIDKLYYNYKKACLTIFKLKKEIYNLKRRLGEI